MKLKRLAEDFRVEEQVSLQLSPGPFALYCLTKQQLGTLEAVNAVARKWQLQRGQIEFAGLKDKHALTTQYVTVLEGQRRGLEQTNLELKYVGQVERPIHASDITGNRFTVVIRDLAADEVQQAQQSAVNVARDGLPNYFDNQRFGSLGESGEFIAKPWCLGDYERALWLVMAEPNAHDRPDEREAKQFLREHWGNWPQCQAALGRSHTGPIITHLVRQPQDFRRAIALLRQDLRSIWLAAFQSHLWNQVLAAGIQEVCPAERCVWQTIGRRQVPFFGDLSEGERNRLATTGFPLPSARLHLDGSPLQPLYDRVLAAEGMELRQVRVKYPRDSFFSKRDRAAVFRPADFEHEAASDDLYSKRQKLTLRFTLPRGSYATILVKQLVGDVGIEELSGEREV